MPKKDQPKDLTSANRTAALKVRLKAGGGKRLSLNLDGDSVRQLDALVASEFGDNYANVIRRLIDDSE